MISIKLHNSLIFPPAAETARIRKEKKKGERREEFGVRGGRSWVAG